MTKTNVFLGVVALLAVAALFVGLSKPSQVTSVLGANPGPDQTEPGNSIGGVQFYTISIPMAATSSAVCSVVNPFGSAATLVSFTANVVTNGLGVAQTLDLSTSSAPYASSSPAYIKTASVGTGAFSLVWNPFATSTSRFIGADPQTGASGNVIGASEYVTLRIATGSPSTHASYYTGTCKYRFQKL